MRGKRALVLVLLVAAGLAVLGQVALPRFAANVIRAELLARTSAEMVTVETRAFPAWKLFSGRLDYLGIDMRNAKFGDLPVSAFYVDGNFLRVDLRKLLGQRREFRVERAESLKATLMLTERDLNQYIWRTADPDRNFKVGFSQEAASFTGQVRVLGVRFNVNLSGRFALVGPTTLRFVPDEFYLAKMKLPRWVLDTFVAKAFTIPLQVKNLPVEVRITRIRLEQGRLYLFAEQAHF